MTEAKGYSLWLMPSGEVRDGLSRIISRLSREHSTPEFEPHVTLLGSLMQSEEEALSMTSRLASLIQPYEMTLASVGYLEAYFRCLFVKVGETEQVMEANLRARNVFSRQQDPEYMPHLSLMYGSLPVELKKEIIAKIGNAFDMSFEVRSIHLCSTNGEPKDWYRLEEFVLK